MVNVNRMMLLSKTKHFTFVSLFTSFVLYIYICAHKLFTCVFDTIFDPHTVFVDDIHETTTTTTTTRVC
jgi:hypothetical protein